MLVDRGITPPYGRWSPSVQTTGPAAMDLSDQSRRQEAGIDFGPYFDEIWSDALEQLGEAACEELRKLAGPSQAECVACYLLRLEPVGDGDRTHFVPQLPARLLYGARRVELPPRLPIEALHRDDVLSWCLFEVCYSPPVLLGGASEGERLSDDVKDFLRRVRWHARMRLEADGKYIGYFKIVSSCQEGGHGRADEATLHRVVRDALFEVKDFVDRRKAFLRAEKALQSPGFAAKLETTQKAILGCSERVALRHVANLLTSHLGARWNRAAFLRRVPGGTLRCVFAQGGDARPEWCHFQGEVATRFPTLQGLVDDANRGEHFDDPYFQAAAGDNPLELREADHPSNGHLLARLWRNGGRFNGLEAFVAIDEFLPSALTDPRRIDRDLLDLEQEPLAVKFTNDDPWVREVEEDRARRGGLQSVFNARNGEYWAIPWVSPGGRIMGIWIVDCCYWGTCRRDHGREPPSLAMARIALDKLAEPFAAALYGTGADN